MKFIDTGNFSRVGDVNEYLGFSDGGYYTVLAYHTLATLIGISGNALVLYGSVKFNAVAVDTVSTILVGFKTLQSYIDIC